MVGNMTGTSLAMGPAFILGQLCDVVDLDGPMLLSRDREPGVATKPATSIATRRCGAEPRLAEPTHSENSSTDRTAIAPWIPRAWTLDHPLDSFAAKDNRRGCR